MYDCLTHLPLEGLAEVLCTAPLLLLEAESRRKGSTEDASKGSRSGCTDFARGADRQAARAVQGGDGAAALEQRAGVAARGPEDVELARLVHVLAVICVQHAVGVLSTQPAVRTVNLLLRGQS